jgi:hypothetical protein
MKKTLKSTHKTFTKKLTELFLEIGERKSFSIFEGFSIPTKYGEYLCSIEDAEFCHCGLTVYGKYTDEKLRKNVDKSSTFGMNSLNGKYNFHFGYVAPEDAEDAAEVVIKGIKRGFKII